ncbi:MAG: hypothetical protein ACRD2O_16720, partial [Terriglobia bacterium]
MEALQNLNELRTACIYRVLRRMLRIGGIESVIFGLWALARGTSLLPANPLGDGLTLIGLFMLLEGIWILAAPGPTGIVLEGITFVVAGLWNLLISATGGPGWILALALLQLVWGVQYFKRYSRFSKLPGKRPSKASLNWLDASVKNLAQARPADSSDVIEFRSPAPWKARLYPNAAMVIT